MSLVFYYSPMSTASMTHIVLEELGISYEKKKVDFKTDTKKPDFLALNPNGKVPVIVHDGTPIFESAAITAYLGETFGVEKNLFPGPGPKRGVALQWLVWSNVSLGEALSRHQHNVSERIPKEQHNAKAAEVAKADVEKHMAILDAALKGKKFLLGDSFSIVDAHVSSFAGYVAMCGFDTKKWPALDAWVKTCGSRPASERAMKAEA
jgi:glutathione S-transferase